MRRIEVDISQLEPWLDERFDRAGGPGGQNVNKVNTRVTLLFAFETCDAFDDEHRARIRQKLGRRLSADGRLRIVCQESRSQDTNRETARQRLAELLTAALHVAATRRPTRPSAGSKRRRLAAKRERSAIKQQRKSGGPADE